MKVKKLEILYDSSSVQLVQDGGLRVNINVRRKIKLRRYSSAHTGEMDVAAPGSDDRVGKAAVAHYANVMSIPRI